MSRKSALVALVAALVAAVPAAAAVNSLDADEPHAEHGILADQDAVLQHDAELIAASADVSVAEAVTIIEHQVAVDALLHEIESAHPADFGGAFSSGTDAIRSTILYKGEPPSDVTAIVAASGQPVEVVSVAHSLSDWGRIRDAAHASLRADGHNDLVVGIDVVNQRLNIELLEQDVAAIGDKVVDLAADVTDRTGIATTTDMLAMELIASPGALFVDNYAYGGDELWDDGTFECTSAFTATKTATGADGVLTAAHCGGLNQYAHEYGAPTTHSAPYVSPQHNGTSGDFEFHTTSGTERDDFYYADGYRRDVSAVQAHSGMNTGDWVCRYGRASNIGICVQVNDLFVTMTVGGTTTGSLIRTNPSYAVTNDSGGPWYLLGTAWGIHKGTYTSDSDSAFSTLINAQSVLSVAVKTS